MKAIKNSANWFLVLFCLEAILPIYTDSPINSIIFWLIIFSSLYFAFVVNARYCDSVYFKKLNWLVGMFAIYGIIYYVYGPTYISPATGLPLNKLSYTTAIFKSMMAVYTFYYLSHKRLLTQEVLAMWIPVFIIVGIIIYYDEMQKALLRHVMSENVTNNAGYYIMSLLPLFLFWRKPLWKYFGMFLVAILVIFAMKRGAVVIMVFMLMYYFYKVMSAKNKKVSLSIVFPSLIFLLGLYYFISKYMMDNAYFMSRIEETLEGDSSSRDDLYNDFWMHILNTNFFNQLFGGGANYTLHVSYNYAHNDWLEIGVNQGILGVLFFAAYWVGLFKRYKKNSLEFPFNVMFGMVLISLFVKTLFSMSYSDTTFFSNICLGYCLARNDIKNNNF